LNAGKICESGFFCYPRACLEFGSCDYTEAREVSRANPKRLSHARLFDDAKILLQNDAGLSLINFNNPTRLDHTSKKGHIDCIRALLKHSPDITSPRALRFAARTGELFSVKLLMDLGAGPWAVDGRGSNALHQAALSTSEKVVKTILEGPKFELANSLDAKNCNALHYSTDSP